MTPSGGPRRDLGAPTDADAVGRHVESADRIAGLHTHATSKDTQAQARRQQAERLDAVGRLAGGVAHEFNNLLTAMIGFTELALRRPGLPADVQTDLLEVARAAQTAASITSELQAFSGGQVLRPRPLALNDVALCVEPLARRLMSDQVTVTLDLATPLPPVHADPAQLEHILLRLLAHAADSMPGGGRIVVQTRLSDVGDLTSIVSGTPARAHVMLAVSDDGPGMDEDAQAHVFEPFHGSRLHGKGYGLRLASVYGVVRQSGGLIDVASRSGDGTTFRVYLPVWDGPHP